MPGETLNFYLGPEDYAIFTADPKKYRDIARNALKKEVEKDKRKSNG